MKHVGKSSYFLPCAVFGSAVLGLGLAIALPYFLGRGEYARFSLALSIGQLASSVAFEWIRVSVVRHAADQGLDGDIIRKTLLVFYLIIVPLLIFIAVLMAIGAAWSPAFAMAATVTAVAAAQGAFDGRSALARANFENVKLAIAMVARPALTLIIVIGGTCLSQSALTAIAGLTLSYIIAFFIFKDTLRWPFNGIELQRDRAVMLTRFGVVAAIGTNIAIAVPAMLRLVIVTIFGAVGAGGSLLALDIAQRIFATIGMALNLLHLQSLIRAIDTAPHAEAITRARYSITLEIALYAWLVAVLGATANPVGRIVAPESFEGDFIEHLPMMALLMAGLCLRQYAVEPLFIAFRRVSLLAAGPIVTLALFGLVFLALNLQLLHREEMLWWLIGASGAGFLIPLTILHRLYRGCIPVGAMLGFGGAAAIVIAVTPTFPEQSPWLELIVEGVMATIIYVFITGLLVVFARFHRKVVPTHYDALD